MEEELNVQMIGAEMLITTNVVPSVSKSKLARAEAADMSENMDEFQKVVKVGPEVRQVKEGDLINLKMLNLLKPIPNWEKRGEDEVQNGNTWIIDPSKIKKIGEKEYLIIRESDVAYIVG